MRKFFLGDWSRWIRDPIDVGKLIFAGGTLAFAAMGRSTAVGLAIASAVLLLARYVNLPRPYDLSLLLAMTLIAWGTALNLYGDWKYYDKLVHGISPALWAPVIYIVLIRLDILPELREKREHHHLIGIFVVTLALGLAIGAGYEICEWLIDKMTSATLVKGLRDTETDLIADLVGATLGGLFIAFWARFGWGTVRRVPGEQVD